MTTYARAMVSDSDFKDLGALRAIRSQSNVPEERAHIAGNACVGSLILFASAFALRHWHEGTALCVSKG